MSMIYVNCPRCGTYLGRAKDKYEIGQITKEHLNGCEG